MERQTQRTHLRTWCLGRRGRDELREQHGDIYGTTCKRWPVGICCLMRELNLVICDNLERWDGWEAGSRGKGHMYTFGWFMSTYGGNQQNIVKQSSFN